MLLLLLVVLVPTLATPKVITGMRRPVDRHVGRWSQPPARCPSSMVTDGPLLGNGDVGAALGGVDVQSDVASFSFYLGKMDFWTQSSGPAAGRTDARHLFTHVAPGRATLTWGSSPAVGPAPPSPGAKLLRLELLLALAIRCARQDVPGEKGATKE